MASTRPQEHYKATIPTAQQVSAALEHLPAKRALTMIERAAIQSGGWTSQLREVARLTQLRAQGHGGYEL